MLLDCEQGWHWCWLMRVKEGPARLSKAFLVHHPSTVRSGFRYQLQGLLTFGWMFTRISLCHLKHQSWVHWMREIGVPADPLSKAVGLCIAVDKIYAPWLLQWWYRSQRAEKVADEGIKTRFCEAALKQWCYTTAKCLCVQCVHSVLIFVNILSPPVHDYLKNAIWWQINLLEE